MPLNGRDWTMLATLTPGVTQPQQGARAGNQFAANGTRPAQNDYLLDGIDNNSNDVDFLSGEADVVKPPVDAIQEFNIQTNNFQCGIRTRRRRDRKCHDQIRHQRLSWGRMGVFPQ